MQRMRNIGNIIVLAMHSASPKDLPKVQVALSVGLHMWLEHVARPMRAVLERYHAKLDTKTRT